MAVQKKIIVAPLNWGLGHASRCIPIIRALIRSDFQPILASDGKCLAFLIKEFPDLEYLELPSYQISYGRNLKWNLIRKIPIIRRAIREENKLINDYVMSHPEVKGIISDNRFGVYSSLVPSVYITHQLKVLAGALTPFTTFIHQQIIKKFDECWIPDEIGSKYSGKLSSSSSILKQKFIGTLSRFKREPLVKTIDLLIVLSGPEPNRSQLEEKMRRKFEFTELNVTMVCGIIEPEQTTTAHKGFTEMNFALTNQMEKLLNSAKYVICRSGYSSIMDLVTLEKPALLIPTKNQSEQEYLAGYHKDRGIFDVVKEKDLLEYKLMVKFPRSQKNVQLQEFDAGLFRLFQGE